MKSKLIQLAHSTAEQIITRIFIFGNNIGTNYVVLFGFTGRILNTYYFLLCYWTSGELLFSLDELKRGRHERTGQRARDILGTR